MTGSEAEQIGTRIAIHLRRNEFAVCHQILSDLEGEQTEREAYEFDAEDEIPIAEVLGHELRYVNALEKAGYIYIDDLDGVDLVCLGDKSSSLYLPWFGLKGIQVVEEGRRRAEVVREERRRRQLKRLEELERVGESLLVERSE